MLFIPGLYFTRLGWNGNGEEKSKAGVGTPRIDSKAKERPA